MALAKIMMTGVDELTLKLSKLESGSDEIAKKAIHKGAGIMADQIADNLRGVLSGTSSGDLLGSLGIAPIKKDEDGDWNTKIGFDGYDSNGVANQLKARVLESGSSKQQKRPFVRPAVSKAKKKAKEAMAQIVDEEIKKIMGG
jgi:HK97 gp10 family phage protein